MSPRSDATEAFWLAACRKLGLNAATPHEVFAFCDRPGQEAVMTELAELVVRGVKRATTSLVWEYQAEGAGLPQPGALSIVLDGTREPRALIRTTRVDVMPIGAVDAEFAAVEGEGDGSLAYWLDVHLRLFDTDALRLGREPGLQMPVVCERFDLLYGA